METGLHNPGLVDTVTLFLSVGVVAVSAVIVTLCWRTRGQIQSLESVRPIILLVVGMLCLGVVHAFNIYFIVNAPPEGLLADATYVSFIEWHWFAEALTALCLCFGVISLVMSFRRKSTNLLQASIERDAATRELNNRMAEFTRAIELSNVGVWHWDVLGKKVYFSDKLQEMLGAASGERIETIDQWSARVDASDAKHQEDIAARFVAGNHSGEYVTEYTATLPNGEERFFITRAGPWFNEKGEAMGLTGADIDVTEIKMLTRELMDAKELAEAANKMKSTFLANISHELRTPLNAIIGFAELLDSEMFGELGDPRYREYAAIIKSSGAHLLEIINDLLDVARIEAGEAIIERTEVDVSAIVVQVVDSLAASAARKGVALKRRMEGEADPVHADNRHVRQIFTNLLSNAIKFTDDGGTVTILIDSTADDVVSIAVSDTGIGIPPEALERVMEPFQQVAQSYTRDHQGTGLGLPISKSLTRLNGGKFDIESEPGVGTTATVHLRKFSKTQPSTNSTTQPNPSLDDSQTRDPS